VISAVRVKLDMDFDDSMFFSMIEQNWEELVGPDLAQHAFPDALRSGELTIIAAHSGWADAIRDHLTGAIMRRINQSAGDGTVTRITVEPIP
jgi:hypothetical protein